MVSHFLFEAEFCNPASCWEKGRIEKNVQDARHRLWQPRGRSDPHRRRQVHRRWWREHGRGGDPGFRLQRSGGTELGLEQRRWHIPRAQQVSGCHLRRDCRRNAASALGLQRHRRSGMALATADPTRETAVRPLPDCRRWRRRRLREGPDLKLRRHGGSGLGPSQRADEVSTEKSNLFSNSHRDRYHPNR
jgi:hypothetical protein